MILPRASSSASDRLVLPSLTTELNIDKAHSRVSLSSVRAAYSADSYLLAKAYHSFVRHPTLERLPRHLTSKNDWIRSNICVPTSTSSTSAPRISSDKHTLTFTEKTLNGQILKCSHEKASRAESDGCGCQAQILAQCSEEEPRDDEVYAISAFVQIGTAQQLREDSKKIRRGIRVHIH